MTNGKSSLVIFCYFHSYVAYTWQNLALHVMADCDVDRVSLVQLVDVDREVVLIVTDALSFAYTILIYQLTVYSISLACAGHMLVVVVDVLLHDEGKSHERIISRDAEPQALVVIAAFQKRWNIERERVVLLPSCNRCMRITVEYGRMFTGRERHGCYHC